MKLLSLWEPWATAMAVGLKRIETRDWATNYTGWLAIHASKYGLKTRDFRETIQHPFMQAALGDTPMSPGCIVCVVKLIVCVPSEKFILTDDENDDRLNYLSKKEFQFGDYSEGRFGWVTRERFRLPEPIPYRAHQGLCQVDAETLEKIREQWRQSKCPPTS